MAIEVKQQKNGVTDLAVQEEMTSWTKQRIFDSLKSATDLQIDLGGVI